MKKTKVLMHFKGVSNVAKALGIAPSSISQWKDTIPEKQAFKLERLTGGKLTYDPSLYKRKS